MSEEKKYNTIFNKQTHSVKITLYNGYDKPAEINFFMVDQLIIEESLYEWYTTAVLILNNDFESVERGIPEQSEGQASVAPLYTFRNDGRNKINIKISLLEQVDPSSEEYTEVEPKKWEINYNYIIYDIEDLPVTDVSKKKKKLYLREEVYQRFSERNIQWSTYYPAAKELKINKPLQDISFSVGKSIKHLIETACGENDYNNVSEKLKIGFDKEGSISKPNLKVALFDDEAWDDGDEENKISYTSAASSNVVDDLHYLMKHYLSTGDTENPKKPCLFGLLRINRYTKKWELFSIKDLFKKSTEGDKGGEKYIERFILQGPFQTSKDLLEAVQKTPLAESQGLHSTIFSYRFVSMSPDDDMNLHNKMSVLYDNKKGTWNILSEDNSIETVQKIIKDDILPSLFSSKGVLLNINEDKLNGLITYPEHIVVQSKSSKNLWQNIMLHQSLFLNHAIEFTSLGSTARTPGMFIGIDRNENKSPDKNSFEDKIIGQWLLVKTKHVFYENTYLTSCVGVKVNSFNEIKCFKKGV